MDRVTALRVELQEVLEGCEKWLIQLPSVGLDHQLTLLSDVDDDVRFIQRLRTRAASALINVAMLGAYSSGKTFLISGLQRKLEYAPVVGEGRNDDKYIGVLPSASRPTTACPASVVPVEAAGTYDTSERGFMRVRFTDSEEWESIGNSPPPVIVAAYATQDQNLIITGRPRQHRNRVVAEIEVLLSNVPLPAKLYDLPGYGSPTAEHAQIIRDSMADADCFIYVTQATHTLSDTDLKLIKVLHDHHTHLGTRVVWVVTGIDRASDLELDDRPQWEATISRDNEYLRENFRLPDQRPDTGFIGRGFMPVSPALEARGVWHLEQGETAAGNRLIAASRMKDLRAVLTDLIESDTGHQHIRQVAAEAQKLILPRHRVLTEILDAAMLPLNRLGSERSHARLVVLRRPGRGSG
ncbi:MAG TPA: dynamin family protein [Candidatus Limnocylindrales bacterium]